MYTRVVCLCFTVRVCVSGCTRAMLRRAMINIPERAVVVVDVVVAVVVRCARAIRALDVDVLVMCMLYAMECVRNMLDYARLCSSSTVAHGMRG